MRKQNSGRWKRGTVTGNTNVHGYTVLHVDGTIYYAHRLAWLYVYGYFPENLIDHIDQNKGNNRISNLRETNKFCNAINSGSLITNTSGVKGVYWDKQTQKWRAAIVVNNKTINLGRYKEKLHAAAARYEAEIKYGFVMCGQKTSAYLHLHQ